MNSSISVVIPNFNGRSLLEKNLPSVKEALARTGLPHEIIVADDDSKDDSVSFLKFKHPDVFIVRNSVNQGFSKNINTGLRKAKNSLVLALNSDVALDKDYFKNQLPFFDSADTFGVMGALCNPETDKMEDGAKACEQSWAGTIRSTKNLLPKDGTSLVTFFLSGANALMSREKLSFLGFYNELFSPFYNEDVELGIRAWRMGWKCYFEPRSKAYHAVSSTIHSIASKKQIRAVSLRNRLFLHDIHLSGVKRFLFFSQWAFSLVFRFIMGDFDFYRASKYYMANRKRCSESTQEFKSKSPRYSFSSIKTFLKNEQNKKQCFEF